MAFTSEFGGRTVPLMQQVILGEEKNISGFFGDSTEVSRGSLSLFAFTFYIFFL